MIFNTLYKLKTFMKEDDIINNLYINVDDLEYFNINERKKDYEGYIYKRSFNIRKNIRNKLIREKGVRSWIVGSWIENNEDNSIELNLNVKINEIYSTIIAFGSMTILFYLLIKLFNYEFNIIEIARDASSKKILTGYISILLIIIALFKLECVGIKNSIINLFNCI